MLRKNASWKPWLMLAPALAVTLLLFGSGLGMAVAQSLGYIPAIGRTELSFDAYRHLLANPAFGASLWLTCWIAGVSTAVSTLLAIVAAFALRRPFRGKRVVTFLFQSNLPIPHLVGGIATLFLFSQSGFLARFAYLVGVIHAPADFPALIFDRYAWGVIIEYIWKSSVFSSIMVLAALQSIDSDYEGVGRTLGANWWQRFRYILWPLLRPAVLTAGVLIFTFTFGAFEVPLLLGTRYPSALPVLAYRLYTDVDLNARPEAMALSVIMAGLMSLFIFFYMQVTKKRV